MEVLLVVAKKDKIQNHTNVISLAGTRPRLSILTLSPCRTHSKPITPRIRRDNRAAEHRRFSDEYQYHQGGMPLFIRDVSVGGNQYTDILQKELQLNFHEAENLKLGKTGGPEAEMVQPLLESITDMLIMEVQKTFDFFRETYPSETISRVLVSGGTSRIAGLSEKIQEVFGYPTELLDPFRSIALGPKVERESRLSDPLLPSR